jgi:hypothetical protein
VRRSPVKLKEPLDFFFRLTEACLRTLRPNAWKVVSFVAARILVAVREEWGLHNDPAMLLKKDISSAWPGNPNPPASPQEDPQFGAILSDSPDSLFPTIWMARISLTELGLGTGLSRSSAAAAADQALSLGVLKRAHERGLRLEFIPSLYGIDWNWVWNAARQAEKKKRRQMSRRSRHRGYPGDPSPKPG